MKSLKNYNEFILETAELSKIYQLGDYRYYATEYTNGKNEPYNIYFILYGDYEGTIIDKKNVQDTQSNVIIQWEDYGDNDSKPKNHDEIEKFTNDNLKEIIKNAPVVL